MLRVALFSHSAQLSGAELMMLRVAQRLDECDVLVVLGEHGPLEQACRDRGLPSVVVEMSPSVGQYRAGSRIPFAALSTAVRSARELAQLLREWEVEVLYTHSAKAHLIGGVAGRWSRVPVVSHAHDLLCAPARGAAGALVQRLGFALLPQARIANSNVTRASAGWASKLEWATVPCPLDGSRMSRPAPRARSKGEPLRLLVLGRIAEWKGQHLAIEALGRLATEGHDIVLDLAGDALFDGDHRYLDRLKLLAESLGVADRVHFLGHVDVPGNVVREADIVLHTSVRPEPFGQVVVEAMAEQRPVVVADSAGVIDLLKPGRDVMTYEAGSVTDLTSAIDRLACSASLRDRMGVAAARSAARFSAQAVVPRIYQVLHDTARVSSPRPLSTITR